MADVWWFAMYLVCPIPALEIRRLEFLLGEFTGSELSSAPDQPTQHAALHAEGRWETSERYLRFELFARASSSVFESMFGVIGHADDAYEMWIFLRSQPRPIALKGDFLGNKLTVVSDPSITSAGVQRLRFTLAPIHEDGVEMSADFWTPDGWQRLRHARMFRYEK